MKKQTVDWESVREHLRQYAMPRLVREVEAFASSTPHLYARPRLNDYPPRIGLVFGVQSDANKRAKEVFEENEFLLANIPEETIIKISVFVVQQAESLRLRVWRDKGAQRGLLVYELRPYYEDFGQGAKHEVVSKGAPNEF